MKLRPLALSLPLLFGAFQAHSAPVLVTNGDFSTPGGASWDTGTSETPPGSPDTVFTFPTSGGSPGGYGAIDNDGDGFGVLVAEGGAIIPLATLGLTAGTAYEFSQDMILVSGSSIGGLKVEYYNGAAFAGDSTDLRIPIIGTGATWETYTYEVSLPTGIDGIKIVPLWGANSEVGFDNIGVDNTPIVVPPPLPIPNGDFENGSTGWSQIGPGTAESFFATGGNPDGYVRMATDSSPASLGILIGNGGGPIPVTSMGVTAGTSVTFQVDMRIDSGTDPGGIRLLYFEANDVTPAQLDLIGGSGDLFPLATIGDGSTWETYEYEVSIPSDVEFIQFFLLNKAGNTVDFDNATVDGTPVTPPTFANGDFESGGALWSPIQGSGSGSVTFPATGGNPDGHAQITDVTAAELNWIGYNDTGAGVGTPVSLASLGFAGGDTVAFTLDMKIFSGLEIGGLRIIPIGGGSAVEIFPTLIGDGSTWETYTFEVTLPSEATAILIDLLGGDQSTVGFDNLDVALLTPGSPDQLTLDIRVGTVVTWTPTDPNNSYQPQESIDNVNYFDLGPEILGTDTDSVFDSDPAPFYRVIESAVSADERLVNGGFETVDPLDEFAPENWELFPGFDRIESLPVRITTDSFSGSASLQLIAFGDDIDGGVNSEAQQNILNTTGLPVTAGASFDFSFVAKRISAGVSDLAQYRVTFLGEEGETGSTGFVNIGPALDASPGEWVAFSETGIVAPPGTNSALIQLSLVVGAIAGGDSASILVDDVSLTESVLSPLPTPLPATANDGVEVSWQTEDGVDYQPRSTGDLTTPFADFGPVISGDGETAAIFDALSNRQFYTVETIE